MAFNFSFGGGGSSSSPYSGFKMGGSRNTVPAREPEGSFLGNLFSDIKNTVIGIPRGVKDLFSHPIRSFERIVDYYQDTYGQGWDHAWETFKQHPLGPILDVISLVPVAGWGLRGATLGVGRGAAQGGGRLGSFLAPAAKQRSYTQGGATLYGRAFSKNPLTRFRQELLHEASKNLIKPEWWLFGRLNRNQAGYSKAVLYNERVDQAKMARFTVRMELALAPLTVFERDALVIRARGTDIDGMKKILDDEVPSLVAAKKDLDLETNRMRRATLDDPRLAEAYESIMKSQVKNPDTGVMQLSDKRLAKADNAMRAAAAEDANMLEKHGVVTREELESAAWDTLRMVHDARYLSASQLAKHVRELNKRENKLEGELLKAQARVQRTASQTAAKTARGAERIAHLQAERGHMRGAAAAARHRAAEFRASLDELDKEIEYQAGGKYDRRTNTAINKEILNTQAEINAAKRRIDTFNSFQDVAPGFRLERIKGLQAKIVGLESRQAALRAAKYVSNRQLSMLYSNRRNLSRALEREEMRARSFDDKAAEFLHKIERMPGGSPMLTAVAALQRIQRQRDSKQELEQLQSRLETARKQREEMQRHEPGWFQNSHDVDNISVDMTQHELGQLMVETGTPYYMPMGERGSVRSGSFKEVANKGIAMRLGRVMTGAETLSTKFVSDMIAGTNRVRAEHLHNASVDHPRGKPIPKGMVPLKGQSGYMRSQEWYDHIEAYIPDPLMEKGTKRRRGDVVDQWRAATVTDNLAEAQAGIGEGTIRIVPKRLVNELAGDYANQSVWANRFMGKMVNAWRVLVLGFSPRFFVNNVVGNNVLYFLQYMGPQGIRALWDMHVNKDPVEARAFLLSKMNKPFNSDNPDVPFVHMLAETFIPEQLGGLAAQNMDWPFLREKMPTTRGQARRQRVRKGLRFGVLPVTAHVAETRVRQRALLAELRKSPEIKARAKAMKGETDAFYKAAIEEWWENPALARQIQDSIHDALGNYAHLSNLERSYIRNVIPFYSWYKAITLITLRMPGRHPLRTRFVAALGAIGYEAQKDEHEGWASYLFGNLDMPDWFDEIIPGYSPADGRTPQLATSGLNPFATIDQLIVAADALTGGGTRPAMALGIANPFIQSFYEGLSGEKILTGAPIDEGPLSGALGKIGFPLAGPLAYAFERPYAGLTQAQIIGSIGSDDAGETLYDRTAMRQTLNWLGLPIRSTNPERAAELGRKELIERWSKSEEGVEYYTKRRAARAKSQNKLDFQFSSS